MSPTWSTASDWDSPQSETGVHHEQPTGVDWAAADLLEKGYPSDLSNIVAYWPLNEDSGTTVNDVVGTNDGSTNGVTQGQSGVLGFTSYQFDGADDDVDIPDASAYQFDSSEDFSIVAVAYIDSNANSDSFVRVFSGDPGGPVGGFDGYRLIYEESNTRFDFDFSDSANGLREDITASMDAWHCVVATHDSSTSTIELYVDGTAAGGETYSGSITPDYTNVDFKIGSLGGNQYVGGFIQDTIILNRVVSSTEATDLYQALI